jgi:hypothetical protein
LLRRAGGGCGGLRQECVQVHNLKMAGQCKKAAGFGKRKRPENWLATAKSPERIADSNYCQVPSRRIFSRRNPRFRAIQQLVETLSNYLHRHCGRSAARCLPAANRTSYR